MSCIWFCVTENTVADIQWTLKLRLTTCLSLYSAQREFSPLKTHCVWSHKRILNKSTLFYVCTVEIFQRHQAPSIHPPVELFPYYVFLSVADRRWSPQGTRPQCVHRLDFIKVQKIAPDRDQWVLLATLPPHLSPSLCLTWQTELSRW